MKQKLIFLLFGFVLSIFATSCIKDEDKAMGDAGTTFIKFVEGPSKKTFFQPFTNIKEVKVFTFRRDPHSNASLQTSANILVELDEEQIEAYNEENDDHFELLPSSMFTYVLDPGVVRNGNQFTIQFDPGEYSKNVKVLIDGSKWEDLTAKYALAFKVTETDGLTTADNKASLLSLYSIVNKYDGVYEVEGSLLDLAGTRFGIYPKKVQLRTVGANTVDVYDVPTNIFSGYGDYNYYYYAAASPVTAVSQLRTIFGLTIEFDPVTGEIVEVVDNLYENCELILDPEYENKFDPDTKTITLKFKTGENGSGLTLGRFIITETYTFKEPRP